MFSEFEMHRALSHPGIVKTMYFLKRSCGRAQDTELEFNIMLEHMAGGNLQ